MTSIGMGGGGTATMAPNVHFSRFKPDNLLLSTARFAGYNLEKYTG